MLRAGPGLDSNWTLIAGRTWAQIIGPRRALVYTHKPTSCLTISPRERMNILCLALVDVLGAVAGSAQSADCARLRCAILGYSKIRRLRRSSKCAQQKRWSFDENRLHQFFGPDFQDNNWHFYRYKFKVSYRIINVFEYLNHYNNTQ